MPHGEDLPSATGVLRDQSAPACSVSVSVNVNVNVRIEEQQIAGGVFVILHLERHYFRRLSAHRKSKPRLNLG